LFAPDGKSLITGQDDSTILVWKLPTDLWQRHHPKRPASVRELEQWWAALAGADVFQAYAAIWHFVDVPEDALRILSRRLKPTEPIPAPSLQRALANLDSNQFVVRQAAQKQLAAWQERAEPALRHALTEEPPLEKRHRIERLLATLPTVVKSSEQLRYLRAVRVLEYVALASPDASQRAAIHLLQKLAAGASEARLTQEAQAALERVKRQRARSSSEVDQARPAISGSAIGLTPSPHLQAHSGACCLAGWLLRGPNMVPLSGLRLDHLWAYCYRCPTARLQDLAWTG
jgi:hypothetical protein